MSKEKTNQKRNAIAKKMSKKFHPRFQRSRKDFLRTLRRRDRQKFRPVYWDRGWIVI